MKPRKSSVNRPTTKPPIFLSFNDELPKCSTAAGNIVQAHNKRGQLRDRKRSTIGTTTSNNLTKRRTTRHSTKRKSSSVLHDIKKISPKLQPKIGAELTTYTCDANHEGRLLLKVNLQLAVDKLFEMLFTNKSKFLSNFHQKRNTKELEMGEWSIGPNGEKNRVVSMIVVLQAAVGPKTAKVIENHTMRACSAKGKLYSIDVESVNQGIPHADVFTILMHYCLTRTKENTTDLMVFGDVNYIKSTWSVVKAFINKYSYEGLTEFFHSLNQELLKEDDNNAN